MPTTRVYRSTDAGAPTLIGSKPQNQSYGLINLLTACLVNGYGALPAAGWTRPYYDATIDTDSPAGAFRQAAGNQMYCRIYDDASGDAAQIANIRGFETMSDIDTGTGPFPDNVSEPTFWYTLSFHDGSGLARPWKVIADDRTAYVFIDLANTFTYHSFGFGDTYSYVASDGYRTGLFGGSDGFVSSSGFGELTALLSSKSRAHVMARNYLGAAGAVNVGIHGDVIKQTGTPLIGRLPYPHPPDNKIWLSPIYIHETAQPSIRGKLRGLWQWLHPTGAIADGDVFSGTGALAGKTFLIIKDLVTAAGPIVVETSSTWDTN